MNVILITLDALSARYMDIYDSDHYSPHFKIKAKTPHIKELLKDSVKYNKCYTNSNMTIVATRELMEGRYASIPWEQKSQPSIPLTDNNLSAILQRNGYKTAAILGAGEDWVFEGYQNKFDFGCNTRMPFDWMIKKQTQWINRTKKPFFIWLHTKETHMGFHHQYEEAPWGNYEGWGEGDFDIKNYVSLQGMNITKNK